MKPLPNDATIDGAASPRDKIPALKSSTALPNHILKIKKEEIPSENDDQNVRNNECPSRHTDEETKKADPCRQSLNERFVKLSGNLFAHLVPEGDQSEGEEE